MSLTISANAKINLGLQIVGRRDDGYHLLHTLFQEIDCGDKIILQLSDKDTSLAVSGPAATGVPTDDANLCLQAATLLKQRVKVLSGVSISLEKRIPPGSGLGGGSSDAAAVLKGLNRLWKLGLSSEELEEMAAELGADVPFFIRGGLQLGEEIGDRLTPLKLDLPYTAVLALADTKVDTAWAYGRFAGQKEFASAAGLDRILAGSPVPWHLLGNDFESIVFARHPELATVKNQLIQSGAVYAGLSGSGSAVFGLFVSPPDDMPIDTASTSLDLLTCSLIPTK